MGPRDLPVAASVHPVPVPGTGGFALLVRTLGDPMRLLAAVRREMAAVDSQVALTDPMTLEELIQRVFFARPRFTLLMLGIFAATGVLLVALGVYGVLAYTVSQQTREIAIRMALGGQRGDVIRMVLRLGLTAGRRRPGDRHRREPGDESAADDSAVEQVSPTTR